MLSRGPQGHLESTEQDRHAKGTFISPLSAFPASQSGNQGRESLFPVVSLGVSQLAPKNRHPLVQRASQPRFPFCDSMCVGRQAGSNGFCQGVHPPPSLSALLPRACSSRSLWEGLSKDVRINSRLLLVPFLSLSLLSFDSVLMSSLQSILPVKY